MNSERSWQLESQKMCFPGSSVVKNPPANARDMSSIPRLGRSPGVGNGNPLQYSCRENCMDIEELGRLQSMGLQKELEQEHHPIKTVLAP